MRAQVEAVVEHAPARHYVDAPDLDAASDVVRRTFGITSFSPAIRVGSDMDTLCAKAAEYAGAYWPEGAESFAIRARRVGEHSYSSQDAGRLVGSAVYRAMEARGVAVRVDLSHPDFALHVEVRHQDAYIYHEKRAGPGGLPLGSQGRMVVLLDSADAAAAAYLMMRRGAQVYPYFIPQTAGGRRYDGPDEEHPAHVLHEALMRWGAPTRLQRWRLSNELLDEITGDPLPDDGVPLTRMAWKGGAEIAKRARAQAIVSGETIRSPWARRLPETHVSEAPPVLRPLMGLTRPIIDDFRELVGLSRLAGPRAEGTERAYTAGGRADAEASEAPARSGVGSWDPY